jgi:hypothetical protein
MVKKWSALRGLALLAATVLVVAGLLFGSGTASADSRAAGPTPASAVPCRAWNVSGDLLYVYSDADTGSAAWGYLWPGGGTGSSAQCAYNGTSTVWGVPYSLCGGGDVYIAVYYPIAGSYVIAYVPARCVSVT